MHRKVGSERAAPQCFHQGWVTPCAPFPWGQRFCWVREEARGLAQRKVTTLKGMTGSFPNSPCHDITIFHLVCFPAHVSSSWTLSSYFPATHDFPQQFLSDSIPWSLCSVLPYRKLSVEGHRLGTSPCLQMVNSRSDKPWCSQQRWCWCCLQTEG